MRNKLKLSIAVFFIAILYSADTKAQNEEGTYHTIRDFETWTSTTLNYKFNKKLRLSLSEQLRLKSNSSTVDQYFTQLGLKYTLDNDISMGVAGRFIRHNDDVGKIQGYENHFRWNTDLGYKHDLSRFSMKYRFRYQSKDELGITTDEPNTHYRIKVGTSYNIRKWKLDPIVSAEIFNGISNEEGFDKIRYTIGTKYDMDNWGEIGLFYRYEKELTGLYPQQTNIAGFKYEYTLKKKKNEK